jgi:hydroxymethylbilane synthase
MAGDPRSYTIASRSSRLAIIQTEIVLGALQKNNPDGRFKTTYMSTSGDKNQTQAIYLLGGKSLWTKELEIALGQDAVDMIVHSLKDVPTTLPDGMEIGGVLEREDPADSLVVKHGLRVNTLDQLPDGSVVGTSSVRRVAQLRRNFPKLKFLEVVGTLYFMIYHTDLIFC